MSLSGEAVWAYTEPFVSTATTIVICSTLQYVIVSPLVKPMNNLISIQ